MMPKIIIIIAIAVMLSGCESVARKNYTQGFIDGTRDCTKRAVSLMCNYDNKTANRILQEGQCEYEKSLRERGMDALGDEVVKETDCQLEHKNCEEKNK